MMIANIKKAAHLVLEKSPWLNSIIISSYTYLRYLACGARKPRHSTKVQLYAVRDLLPAEWKGAELFFGYYDKPAENRAGYILVNASQSRKTSKLPSASEKIYVLVIDKNKLGSTPLLTVETYSYNWQQGCRAQWLTDDLFIMNIYDAQSNSYISKVYSVEKKSEVKHFSHPVQDSYKDEFFLSINYRRVMALRPDYGYRNIPSLTIKELRDVDNDGIWRVDFHTGENNLFLTLRDIVTFQSNQYPEDALHKVNHLMISPDGKKFIFIHRYYSSAKRNDRLLVCDLATKKLRVLANNKMVSHCIWKDNTSIVAYLRSPEGKDAFYIIDVTDGSYQHIEYPLFNKFGDGHPTYNGNLLVADSYQDSALQRHLICHNYSSGTTKEIGSFYQAMRFNGECRCDLHPRFSADGKTLYFDAVFTGKRCLYYMKSRELD